MNIDIEAKVILNLNAVFNLLLDEFLILLFGCDLTLGELVTLRYGSPWSGGRIRWWWWGTWGRLRSLLLLSVTLVGKPDLRSCISSGVTLALAVLDSLVIVGALLDEARACIELGVGLKSLTDGCWAIS